MNGFDWKALVGAVAPVLGTALGGPYAGLAVKFLCEQWLVDPEANEADLEAAFQRASPASLMELKKLNQDFETQMKQLGIDVFKLEVEDRASAREMYKTNVWPQIGLSAIFVLGYFTLLILSAVLLFSDDALTSIKTENEAVFFSIFGVLTTLVGVITGEIPRILGFWFGSTAGSSAKTSAMVDVMNKRAR